MAEEFGVDDRGAFYDANGAIRDVVQNHLLQVLTYLAMEPPVGTGVNSIRDEKVKVLRAVPPLDPSLVVLGQFGGYRDVEGVALDSQVETFAAIRLEVRTWRWEGVPFYLRAGKCLPESCTEVFVMFRKPMAVYGETSRPNHLRFRLSPRIEIGLGAQIVGPEEHLTGKSVELQVGPQESPARSSPTSGSSTRPSKETNPSSPARTPWSSPGRSSTPLSSAPCRSTSMRRAPGDLEKSSSILRGEDRWHDPVVT